MTKSCFRYVWLVFVCFWNVKYAELAGAQVNEEDEFEDYLSYIECDFYNFEDSINRDFADYLEQAWQEFTVYDGVEPPPFAGVLLFPGAKEPLFEQSHDLFFGSPLCFPDIRRENISLSNLSEREIAAGWRRLGSVDLTPFFKVYMRYSQQFCLNDWGNYQLLVYASRFLFPSLSSHEQTLFLFYVLSNAGYKVKIGRADKELVLLLPFAENVYKLPFIVVENRKYYVMDLSLGKLKKLYSIVPDFPKAEKFLSLHISKALEFPENTVERKFAGKYSFTLYLNRNLLDFYATFPLCDLSVYFSAEPSKIFTGYVDQFVRVHLKGKSRLQQIAWLLDFVQQTFTHKPDIEVHKAEVYYFPEETFFYPYADCEDLSVLLLWLVRRYVTDDVLILYYPTHVAIAVECREGYLGATLNFRNKEYLICDPSYRGAKPGMLIPSCASLKPVIVSYFK